MKADDRGWIWCASSILQNALNLTTERQERVLDGPGYGVR
jgi:hypothetical protein